MNWFTVLRSVLSLQFFEKKTKHLLWKFSFHTVKEYPSNFDVGKYHKKLSVLTEFLNSIFIKFYFKAYWCWTCILGFYYFKLFICPPNVRRSKFLRVLPSEPPPVLHHEPPHLHFTTFEHSIIVQKWMLVKLFG